MSKASRYDRWRERLEGKKVVAYTQPDAFDLGFYRLPVRERDLNKVGKTNGKWKTVGFKPVALFLDGNQVIGMIGDKPMTPIEVDEMWGWIVQHPISEEVYRAVAEKGEDWPDFEPLPVGADPTRMEPVPAADRAVTAADNIEPEQPPDVQHATAIDNAIAAAIKTVTNETEAAQALGSKNRIAELRLAADKAGKAIYDPIYRQYTAEQKKWSPIVARATAKEKELNTELLKFRERERQRIYAEQEAAAAKQREIDEANQRAADRAIAAGEPEPEPIVQVDDRVFAPDPLLPTYGSRRLKEELKKFVVIDDITAVFTRFKSDPQVIELLTKLAQKEIDAGRNVPGTHTREGLI